MSTIRLVVWLIPVAMAVAGAGVTFAQDYPNKPIRLKAAEVGGGNDFAARLVTEGISGPLGQPVIVENQCCGTTIAEVVAKAPPDGYTLMIGGATHILGPLLQKTSYDIATDFSPITTVVSQPNLLVVPISLPVKSVKELIALAKASPGKLNYGSGPAGSSTHLAGELFKSMAGVNIVRIPYKGNGPALTDLITGELQMMIVTAPSVAPHLKSGRLRALAVTSAKPSPLAPGLPTAAASGLPGYEVVGIVAIWAPARTPAAIVNRLNQEIVRVLNRTDVKQKFFDAGVDVVGSSPEELAATIKAELARWSKVIKDAGIRVE